MKISNEVKDKVLSIVKKFNSINKTDYECKFRGEFLYLGRSDKYGGFGPVSRLKYSNKINDWDFAIYKYSSEGYDDREFFPGIEFLDGTIEGALKAGMSAYP